MNPDIVFGHPVEEAVGNRAQALAPAGAVLSVTQHLHQPPGRADDERQEQKQAVKRIHVAIVNGGVRADACAQKFSVILSGGAMFAPESKDLYHCDEPAEGRGPSTASDCCGNLLRSG